MNEISNQFLYSGQNRMEILETRVVVKRIQRKLISNRYSYCCVAISAEHRAMLEGFLDEILCF